MGKCRDRWKALCKAQEPVACSSPMVGSLNFAVPGPSLWLFCYSYNGLISESLVSSGILTGTVEWVQSEHLQRPISLMESSITDSSLGLTEEPCRERGDCLNSAEDGEILGMRVGAWVGSDHSGPFAATTQHSFNEAFWSSSSSPGDGLCWVHSIWFLPWRNCKGQAPGSSITDWNPIHSITFHP